MYIIQTVVQTLRQHAIVTHLLSTKTLRYTTEFSFQLIITDKVTG